MSEAITTEAHGAAKPTAPANDAKPASDTKPAVAAATPAAAAHAETPKRGRGRPLGAKSKPKAAAKPAVAKPVAAKVAKASPTKAAISTSKPIPSMAARAASTASKGSRTMNDTIMTMQDTAKKFTGEASARAKGAYEKGLKLSEEMTEFQKGNVEAIVESSKRAAKAVETLGQEAADYARKSYETGTAAFKTFASAKSPTELFKLQSDYAKSYFDSAVAQSSKLTEAWLKLAGDVAQPLSNRMAVAVDKVKVAAAF